MTTKYFNVKVGLTTGNITLDATTGNVTAINASLGNLVTSNYFSGSGNLLSDLVAGNISGQVANALIAGTVYTNAQPNITSVGTLTSLTSGLITATSGGIKLGNIQDPTGTNTISLASGNVTMLANLQVGTGGTGNVTATYFIGNGSQLTGLPATYANSNVAAYLPTYTGNITGNIITLTGNVTAINASLGNLVTANYFTGNGSLLTNLNGSNVTGQVANALIAGTVYTNAQPNITSVGTLSSLNVTANITSGNASLGNLVTANNFTATGDITANNFITSGSGGNISGANNITANTFTGTLTTAAQPNITSLGTLASLTVTANVSSGNANLGNLATASFFSGAGNLLSNIVGGNVTGQVANALIAGTVYTNAQPNITSVGTLSGLTVTGDAVLTGNLTVTGTTSYVNSTNTYIEDPIVEQGGGANNATLLSDDGKDRGTVLDYFSTTAKKAFMGWDNSNAEFALGSVVTVASEVVTFSTFGNLRVNYIIGNGSALTSLTGANVTGTVSSATTAGTVTTNAQPNITSTGTLVSLNVTGNISSGNANLGNLVTASFFSGAGNLLSNIVGGNVTGQVANALIAGTVYTNAQPNITSTGTLVSLNVTGNISSGNANLGNLVTASYFSGSGNLLSNIQGGNVSGTVSSATTAGTVTSNAQPNITSVGTLTSLVIGNATSNVTITDGNGNGFMTSTGNITAPYFIGNVVGNISGTLTVPGNNTAVLFNQVGAAGASDAFKFDYAANTLTLTGNLTSYNANLGNLVTANYFTGSGNLLSNIQGANVTGTVSSATTAGTVTTNAQPNITSTGTLVSLNVTGNISSGNANLGNLVTANYFTGSGNLLSNIQGANVSGAVATATAATTAGTVTTSAQPNITSTGTLVSVAVTGNTTTGNVKVTGGVLSNRSNVSIPGTSTDIIIDQFPTTSFRSAKYYITGKGTNGYQTAEILLVQDGTNSYITIYGSICSNNTADILNFSSNIDGVSGNVRVYANTVSASTTVNLLPIYLND
jgi:hypothetical protein